MIRIVVVFAVLVAVVLIATGAVIAGVSIYRHAVEKEKRKAQDNQQKALTDPEKVAEKAAEAYVENDLDSIRQTLRTAAQDWKDKDWKKFHKERETIIENMRAKDSRLSSEMQYLEELNRKDNAVDNALNALRNDDDHVTANAEWERLFAREIEKDKEH